MTGAASVVGRPTGIDGGSFGFLAREGRAVAPAPHSVPGFIRHGWRITVATLRSGWVSSTALQQFFSPSTLFLASCFVSRIALQIVLALHRR
jgi:hypothetical protein